MNEELKKILINKLGIEGAAKEVQEAMLDEIGILVYQGALIRAMEHMSDEEVTEFEKLTTNNPSPDEVFVFIKSRVESFESIITEEAEAFVSKANNIMDQIGKE